MTDIETVSMEEYEKLKKSVDFIINRRKEIDAENLAKKETAKKEHLEFISKVPHYISFAIIFFSVGFVIGIAIIK